MSSTPLGNKPSNTSHIVTGNSDGLQGRLLPQNPQGAWVQEAIIQRAKQLDHEFTYEELDLEGVTSRGYLRRAMKILVDKDKMLRLPHSYPARYIMAEWKNRPEYFMATPNNFKGNRGGMGGSVTARLFDVVGWVERLGGWGELSVHNIRFWFPVGAGFGGEFKGWRYVEGDRSYRKDLRGLVCPVHVAWNDYGVTVTVACSLKPYPVSFDGMVALASLVGRVYDMLGGGLRCPPVNSWLIIQWHLNKDAHVAEGAVGAGFYLTFRDFQDQFCRLYYKKEIGAVRVEAVQDPKATMPEVMNAIMSDENIYRKFAENGVTKGVTVDKEVKVTKSVTIDKASSELQPLIDRYKEQYKLNPDSLQALNDYLAEKKRKEGSARVASGVMGL